MGKAREQNNTEQNSKCMACQKKRQQKATKHGCKPESGLRLLAKTAN